MCVISALNHIIIKKKILKRKPYFVSHEDMKKEKKENKINYNEIKITAGLNIGH